MTACAIDNLDYVENVLSCYVISVGKFFLVMTWITWIRVYCWIKRTDFCECHVLFNIVKKLGEFFFRWAFFVISATLLFDFKVRWKVCQKVRQNTRLTITPFVIKLSSYSYLPYPSFHMHFHTAFFENRPLVFS